MLAYLGHNQADHGKQNSIDQTGQSGEAEENKRDADQFYQQARAAFRAQMIFRPSAGAGELINRFGLDDHRNTERR